MYINRNNFLNTTAMFLAPDAPKEGENKEQEDTRSEAQKQRDAVEMNESTDDNKNKDEKKEGEEEEGEGEEENDDESNDEENEDDDNKENKNEEDEEKEETEAEKTARLAQEKKARSEARVQRRIDKAVAAQKAAEERADAAEARLKEKPVDGLTEEEVARRAQELADKKLADKLAADNQKKFENDCDALETAATKADKNFPRAVTELTEELGPIPGVIIGILADLDNKNGGDVLAYLAKNIDESEDLFELKGSPHKLAIKLTRISDKLKEEKKPKRERSSVSPPIEPVSGNTRDNSIRITGKETQEEFNAKRARQEEERRRVRGY